MRSALLLIAAAAFCTSNAAADKSSLIFQAKLSSNVGQDRREKSVGHVTPTAGPFRSKGQRGHLLLRGVFLIGVLSLTLTYLILKCFTSLKAKGDSVATIRRLAFGGGDGCDNGADAEAKANEILKGLDFEDEEPLREQIKTFLSLTPDEALEGLKDIGGVGSGLLDAKSQGADEQEILTAKLDVLNARLIAKIQGTDEPELLAKLNAKLDVLNARLIAKGQQDSTEDSAGEDSAGEDSAKAAKKGKKLFKKGLFKLKKSKSPKEKLRTETSDEEDEFLKLVAPEAKREAEKLEAEKLEEAKRAAAAKREAAKLEEEKRLLAAREEGLKDLREALELAEEGLGPVVNVAKGLLKDLKEAEGEEAAAKLKKFAARELKALNKLNLEKATNKLNKALHKLKSKGAEAPVAEELLEELLEELAKELKVLEGVKVAEVLEVLEGKEKELVAKAKKANLAANAINEALAKGIKGIAINEAIHEAIAPAEASEAPKLEKDPAASP